MRLTRNRLGLVLALAGITSACATSAPVGITKSEAMVAGCEKVGDVSVEKKVPADQANDALAAEARKKGANYIIVAEDGARAGTAYRCTAPSPATSSGH